MHRLATVLVIGGLLSACETMSMPAQISSDADKPARQQASQPEDNAGQQFAGGMQQSSKANEKPSQPIYAQQSAQEPNQAEPVTPGQSSVDSQKTTDSPADASKQSWASQQAASKSDDKASESGLPWHQRMADQSMRKKKQSQQEQYRQVIRRVEIDPETGLYKDTSQQTVSAGVSKNMSFDNRQQDLLEWGFWELNGRIGISVNKDTYNGSLQWEQEGDELDFRFRGPLGIGGVRIHGDLGQEVRVKTTRGEEFFLRDIEKDMQEQLGWSMPINSLRYWSLGITDPQQDAEVVLNDQDLLDEMQQGEWTIVYDSYTDVDGVSLPRKFKISGPQTKIRMVINDWTIPELE
ncbi:MAG: outer membrane lipoprotein LolB [Gammaproteobacteria bacterium]|nr:outer membrane lipoprotein LolB [Gammaproteobacteria bacterium]